MENTDSSGESYHLSHLPSYRIVNSSNADSPHQASSDNVQHDSTSAEPATEQATAKRPPDSAYNSEHEHSPEQPEESPDSPSKEESSIKVKLIEEELWKSFHKIGNEMIVTKPGR